MPRLHFIILALGVLLIVLAGLGEDERPAPETDAIAGRSAELGEPDLLMDTAEISQFSASGALAYRIRAISIVHYPDADHTLLEAPRLTLYRPGEPPWEVSAERGRIIGGSALLDAGTGPRSVSSETVELADDVVVQRQRPGEGFIALRTEALTLYPAREYAETRRPVIIDTESGRTTAEGLRANLEAGTLDLGSQARRVRTTLFPGTL